MVKGEPDTMLTAMVDLTMQVPSSFLVFSKFRVSSICLRFPLGSCHKPHMHALDVTPTCAILVMSSGALIEHIVD